MALTVAEVDDLAAGPRRRFVVWIAGRSELDEAWSAARGFRAMELPAGLAALARQRGLHAVGR